MNDTFLIYVRRLGGGKHEQIDLSFPGSLLSEGERLFPEAIAVTGQAYLAEDHLVMQFDIDTEVQMPCSICNGAVTVPVINENFYSTVPLEEIKTDVYNFSDQIQEAILLEIPQFVECEGGCKERSSLGNYFARNSDEVHHPFASLELDNTE